MRLVTPAHVWDEVICAAVSDDGQPIADETAARLLQIPAGVTPNQISQPPAHTLVDIAEKRKVALVGTAQQRLSEFMNEEEDRLDAWRNDARVAFDEQIKALTKEANEKAKLARATLKLDAKLELQREAKALKRQVDDLQHQLYTRLREIDEEREAMLDAIADKLNLTPQVEHLFTIRWSLT